MCHQIDREAASGPEPAQGQGGAESRRAGGPRQDVRRYRVRRPQGPEPRPTATTRSTAERAHNPRWPACGDQAIKLSQTESKARVARQRAQRHGGGADCQLQSAPREQAAVRAAARRRATVRMPKPDQSRTEQPGAGDRNRADGPRQSASSVAEPRTGSPGLHRPGRCRFRPQQNCETIALAPGDPARLCVISMRNQSKVAQVIDKVVATIWTMGQSANQVDHGRRASAVSMRRDSIKARPHALREGQAHG